VDRKKFVLSIVVPVYNEEQNIPILYDRVKAIIRPLAADYEFIFVDDGSEDASVPVVLNLRRQDSRVRLLSLSRNFSHQIALTAGLDHTQGDAVICMDADLQHPPEMIPSLIVNWQAGYDIVGTERRDIGRTSFFKKFTAKIFYQAINRISDTEIDVNSADFRLLDRKVVEILRQIRERHRFLRGLVNWVGFKKIVLPYDVGRRLHGKSKYSVNKMVRFALDGIVAFSEVPLIIAAVLGGLLSLSSFLYGCIVVYQRLFTAVTPPGWASLLASILFLNGLIMLFLGIIGVYIAAIHNEVKKRPLYIVRDAAGIEVQNAVFAKDGNF